MGEAQLLVAAATAAATIALVWVTGVLARETKRLSNLSSQPFVVAAIEPSPWAINHVEIVVENSGNGAAFDIKVVIDPEVEQAELREKRGFALPFKNISLLRPSQTLRSYLCEAKGVLETEFTIEVSWGAIPQDKHRQSLKYTYDMKNLANLTQLGASSPAIQVAQQIKHMREDWRAIANGTRKLRVDTFTNEGRREEGASAPRD